MRAYLGLGSNQGDRLASLRAARDALGEMVVASSSVWETAPQGEVLDQPDFLNAAVAVDTELEPRALFELCKEVERRLGREEGGVRHGPRPIDLDLLLLGDRTVRDERLTLPHPAVLSRRFVIEPLLELDPALRLPGGARLADALEAVADQRVERLGPL